MACKEYAFSVLHAGRVYPIVWDTNTAAQRVALQNGMRVVDRDTKNFRGVEMTFLLYSVERD